MCKRPSMLIMLLTLILITAACGKNGELNINESSPPEILANDLTGDLPGETENNATPPPGDGPCCNCTAEATCQCSCGSGPCNTPLTDDPDIASGGGEDIPTGDLTGDTDDDDTGDGDNSDDDDGTWPDFPVASYNFIPQDVSSFIPKHDIPHEVPEGTTEDNDKDGEYRKGPQLCLNLDDDDAKWWLTYLLTGGFLSYTKIEGVGFSTEELAEGTELNFTAALPEGSEIVLEASYLLGEPLDEENVVSYIPDEFSVNFINLPVIDPVFGYIELSGEIHCHGKGFYYKNSDIWNKYHTCSTAGGLADPLTLNFFNTSKHEIIFGVNKTFKGNTSDPENTTFNGGWIKIDGINYNLGQFIPQKVIDCIKASSSRT